MKLILFWLLFAQSLNASTVLFLHGTSRSGKSVTCQHLEKDPNFYVATSLYCPFLLETLSIDFPKELASLREGLEDDNMRPAITRNFFVFKETATEKQKQDCQKAAMSIRQVFSDPKVYSLHKEAFRTFSLEKIKTGLASFPYVLADTSWYLYPKDLPNAEWITVLLYCPLSSIVKRLLKENASSLARGNAMNYRFFTDVFISFFSFYQFSKEDKGSVDVCKKSEIFSLLDKIELLLSDEETSLSSPFLMPELSRQDLTKYRSLFAEQFQGEEKLYIVPKMQYDLILHTKDLTPEESAEQIIAFVHTHTPKIQKD